MNSYNLGVENKSSIGKKIKRQRLDLNLRMNDLASKVGITRATLWAIENGSGNYSIDTLVKLLNYLNLSLDISGPTNNPNRDRATRTNTVQDKKINRFIIMSIEQYASFINKDSKTVYKLLNEKGIIDELVDDYEDMHGMSTVMINEYIDTRLKGV